MAVRYHPASRALHGIMSLLIFMAVGIGLWMTNEPKKLGYYGLHMSVGVLVLSFAFLRILVRSVTDAPGSFYKSGSFNFMVDKSLVFCLYVLMFLVPLSGYLMINSAGSDVMLFGLKMPSLTAKNIDFSVFCHGLHVCSCYVFVGLILFHIGNVIYRTAVKKHNILKRMI